MRHAVRGDARILALSHGTRQVLGRLGVWDAIEAAGAATPIRSVHVSHRHGLGRTRIHADELGVEALGYVLPSGALIAALDAAIEAVGIDYRESVSIAPDGVVVDAEGVSLGLAAPKHSRGDTAHALPGDDQWALVAWAEGVVAADAAQMVDYGQHAVLCTVGVSGGHGHVAWERFTDDGPLALLPLGDAYAVVLGCASVQVDAVLAMDDGAFCQLLYSRFGDRHRFVSPGARVAYPLGKRWRRDVTAPRQVWLGNAAQTLHPVAGQGFNLAVRDIWELARALGAASDAGAGDALAAYARGRQVDRQGTMGFTDLLIDVFSTDLPPLKHLRGAGLLALDLLPPLRRFVARRMMFGANGLP